ncbi:MAG: M20/M25/M40 family metallo-hydrolase [Emcibacter sp.]|nr:M20/M25/M40 family metallo-hydrolase [Emcibacter sp.]
MLRSIISIFVFILSSHAALAADTIHHKMDITLNPASHLLTATDTITIPPSLARNGMTLQINSDLMVEKISGKVTFKKIAEGKNAKDIGIDRDNDKKDTIVKVTHYKLDGITSGDPITLTLKLSGVINNPVIELNEEYARGFSQSPGLIEERGVYLAGATYWVPTVKDTLITYDITVKMPADWRSVSQGARVKHETGDFHVDGWKADTPTEEIYLIAAKFTEYEIPVGNVKAMAFLRTPDDVMAQKYLETTAQYMEMYREMLGPYPYTKFALVENFWETGYGMPSFTLLGSQIIRFPFILHSSYPHELLHNWWGNGVFIDFETGNWAEGLTAYMADHLVAEQRGKGADYRRSTLQRYTSYVDDKTDFPLRKFRSRHNAVTEAVGYGKTSMMWNMLRGLVGDEDFKRSFQRFYRNHKFGVGTFDDIRVAFEGVTDKDLKPFFAQWVDDTGAPELTITRAEQSGKKLKISLKQLQKHAPFTIQVPVAVYTKDKVERHLLQMNKRSQDFSITMENKVARIEIDPEFDLFRRLHWAEIPPSLGSAFGAEKVVMILPSDATDALQKRYLELTTIWSGGNKMTVLKDSDIETLPTDGAIWILGQNNRFYGVVKDALKNYDASATANTVQFGKQKLSLSENSTVIAVRNPSNPQSVIVGLTVHNDAAVKGLARKLPHYGKYSYLAFTNEAPDNSAKGQWPAVGSPLVAVLDKSTITTAHLKPRPALAQLKPVFDGKRMMSHVEYLASPELEGRGVGTKGLEKAASYITDSFIAAGLKPAGENGSWFQSFDMTGPDDKKVTVKNIVGIIPGKNPNMNQQSVVLSAHYDHLGYGWPNVRAAYAGQIHPGADDNASGIAVLLELAKSMAKSSPDRTIVFLASTAEESGLLGARHYVKTMKDYPAIKAIANVNLDTVGRAGEKIMIFGGTSATEWRFIFMGTTATTGIQTDLVMQAVNASDHTAFIEAGVPAIHIFGSPTTDYHRPGDKADTVNIASLMKVAALTKEVVEYLGGRVDPLTSTLKPADPNAPKVLPAANKRSGRKVSTGAMPDFAFSGKGVKVSQVAPGSAGANAGLTAGDIITRFGGESVTNLRDYTKILGKYNPGDKVDVIVKRGDKNIPLVLTLKKR